jgi:Pyruvate/2-oxoacid:ferredoxin oxidoreductase delta subunit
MNDSVYLKIARNFDDGVMRAPRIVGAFSPAFIEYLKLMYKPAEAEFVQHLKTPNKFMTSEEIAQASGRSAEEVRSTLDPLAARSNILGFGDAYCLPQMGLLFNVHQFRRETGVEAKRASELYTEFFIKDGYYKYYESSEKGTQVMRVITVGKSLDHDQKILDAEEAHRLIDAASDLALSPCPCRSRTEQLGTRQCKGKFPVGSCIMTGTGAAYYKAHGLGKDVSAKDAKKYFDEMQEAGLVGITENFEDNSARTVICLCCDCCCSQVRGRTRWQNPGAVAPSNFVAESSEDCIQCGTCEGRCLFKAITLDEKMGRSVVDATKCMGCGVCAIACAQSAMRLKRVERETIFPTSRELYKKIAVENHQK